MSSKIKALCRLFFVLTLILMMPAKVTATTDSLGSTEFDPDTISIEEMLDAAKSTVLETFNGILVNFETSSIIVLDNDGLHTRIRLYGVDFPESDQSFHDECAQFEKEHFLNIPVKALKVGTDTDNIPVALVIDEKGKCLSHFLILSGMAWWDAENTPKDNLMKEMNATAIIAGRGIFADSTPLSPWDYRNAHNKHKATYFIESQRSLLEILDENPVTEEDKIPLLKAKGTMTQNLARPVRIKRPPVSRFPDIKHSSPPKNVPPGNSSTSRLPSPFPQLPFPTQTTQTVEKKCGECRRSVPNTSQAGGKCPFCGVRWDIETTEVAHGITSPNISMPQINVPHISPPKITIPKFSFP